MCTCKLPKTLKAQKSNWNRRHFCMCNDQHLDLTACQSNKSFDWLDFEIDYKFSDKI